VVDTTSWADNGADFYINSGIKYLDRLDTVKKSTARSFPQITSGDWYVLVQNCRAIKEVWASDVSGIRWKLEKKDFNILRTAYNELPTQLDGGSPLYYSPVHTLRKDTETDSQVTIDYFYNTEITEAVDHFTYNALVFMPPADATYRLEVVGLFDTPELVNDADENYWSVVHPIVLVMAAARSLEAMYRNTQGVNDWTAAIKAELFGISLDLIEEEVFEVTQMEG
jgi:hypothetical protein